MSIARGPYVFLVGCPRSGTGLLQRMLDSHPDLTVASNTRFITAAAAGALKRDPDPPLSDRLVEKVWRHPSFLQMQLGEDDVIRTAGNCRTYSAFVAGLYALRAQRRDKRFSGEQSPGYCREIPQLHALFPRARFVHVIRDGRNTALATLSRINHQEGPGAWESWAMDPVGTCALWWIWHVRQGRNAGRALDPALYTEVRFEELSADPEGVLRRLSEFLELPYAAGMLDFGADQGADFEREHARRNRGVPAGDPRDWRTQMKPEDLAVFDGIAFELLDLLDYELSGNPPTRRAVFRMDRSLAWWENQPMADD